MFDWENAIALDTMQGFKELKTHCDECVDACLGTQLIFIG